MAEPPISLTPDDVARLVTLIFGRMSNGLPYWCYVAVKPSRMEEFQRAASGKQYDIRNFESEGYGEIIVSGESTLPPRDVTKQVSAMFNVPIRQFFADADHKALIQKEIARLEGEINQ